MLNVIKCPLCNRILTSLYKNIRIKMIFSVIVKLLNVIHVNCILPTHSKRMKLHNYNNSYHQSAHGGIITDAKTKGFFLVCQN